MIALLAFALEQWSGDILDRVRAAVASSDEDVDFLEAEVHWYRIGLIADLVRYSIVFLLGVTCIEFGRMAFLGAPEQSASGGYLGAFLAAELGQRACGLYQSVNQLVRSRFKSNKRSLLNLVRYAATVIVLVRGDGTPCWVLGALALAGRAHVMVTNVIVTLELNQSLPMAQIDTCLDAYSMLLLGRVLLSCRADLGVLAMTAVLASLTREGVNIAMRLNAERE